MDPYSLHIYYPVVHWPFSTEKFPKVANKALQEQMVAPSPRNLSQHLHYAAQQYSEAELWSHNKQPLWIFVP